MSILQIRGKANQGYFEIRVFLVSTRTNVDDEYILYIKNI